MPLEMISVHEIEKIICRPSKRGRGKITCEIYPIGNEPFKLHTRKGLYTIPNPKKAKGPYTCEFSPAVALDQFFIHHPLTGEHMGLDPRAADTLEFILNCYSGKRKHARFQQKDVHGTIRR